LQLPVSTCEQMKATVKWVAAVLLVSGCGARVDVGPLLAGLGHEYPAVRADAAKALGRVGDTRAVTPLIAALKDSDCCVRDAAAAALGELKDRRAVVPLIEALGSRQTFDAETVAWALVAIGDPRAVTPLIRAYSFSGCGTSDRTVFLAWDRWPWPR